MRPIVLLSINTDTSYLISVSVSDIFALVISSLSYSSSSLSHIVLIRYFFISYLIIWSSFSDSLSKESLKIWIASGLLNWWTSSIYSSKSNSSSTMSLKSVAGSSSINIISGSFFFPEFFYCSSIVKLSMKEL